MVRIFQHIQGSQRSDDADVGGQATLAYNGAGTAHSGGNIWVGSVSASHTLTVYNASAGRLQGASATIKSGGVGTYVPFVSGGLILGGGTATICKAKILPFFRRSLLTLYLKRRWRQSTPPLSRL